MIVTEKKPLSEIIDCLENYREIAILGCGDCATICNTGGEEQVEELKKKLEEHGKKVIYTSVIKTSCDERLVRLELKKITGSGCIISLSCGTGAQTISGLTENPVITGLNSMYAGSIKRIGNFSEKCSMCGDCLLNEYGGICPVTRCPKHLLNGPCGGSFRGKCEEDNEKDCAWVLILKKIKKIPDYKEPKKWK